MSAESVETRLSEKLEADDASQELIDGIRSDATEAARADPTTHNVFGEVGRPFDRRAPFIVGFGGALGVVCALAVAWVVVTAGQVLVLLLLAFLIAAGLDPAVLWLYRRGLPRWAAVTLVILAAVGIIGGFIALAVPVVASQASKLATEIPHYLHTLSNRHTELGKLNAKYHIVAGLQKALHGSGTFNSAIGIGKALLGFLTAFLVVTAVSIYILADMPRVRRAIYLLAPHSRRPRMVLLTDEILARVGGYVLGNILLSIVAGVGTTVWALIFGIPYALLLGVMVALLDLIPVVGSTIGGIVVSLVALTISLPVAIATAIFYTGYRFLEDYLLTPRVMLRTVEVPGLMTVIATVIGAALLGIIGALVAIPVAAALKLLHEEIAAPRLEEN